MRMRVCVCVCVCVCSGEGGGGGGERIVSFLDFAPPTCWWSGVSIVPMDGLSYSSLSSFWAQQNIQILLQCYLEVLAFVLVIVIILIIYITCTFFSFFLPDQLNRL